MGIRQGQARQRCWRDDWVLDRDIRGFFEALEHNLVMKAVSKFTPCKWTLLYLERGLKADVLWPNGERLQRTQGTPPGGVIRPLLANIFLHVSFDNWMQKEFSCIHFERYADDIVVHGRRHKQWEFIERKIRARCAQCKLALCQEKTKIVYGKDSNREGKYPRQSFDFLGYTFRPRSTRDRKGKFFVSFSPAVSRTVLKAMRLKIKDHPMVKGCFSESMEELASVINPLLQGGINYYGRFRRSSMFAIYDYINSKLMKWVRRKDKHRQRRKKRAGQWLRDLYLQAPTLFAHGRVWSWVAE